MDQEELQRRAEALRAIYRTRGEELSEIESKTLANHFGGSTVLIAGLVAFFVWRFLF